MEENNITVDKAVQTIKGAILRAQAQASLSSNAIQLSLYYGIGRYVSINLQQAHWGAKALDTISERLQRELPGLRGFSSGNLKKMRIFYEEWQCLSIGSPMANQLQQLENKIEEGVEIGEKTLLCINRPIELLMQRSFFSPISTPSSILFSSCCNWFAIGEPIERHCHSS